MRKDPEKQKECGIEYSEENSSFYFPCEFSTSKKNKQLKRSNLLTKKF